MPIYYTTSASCRPNNAIVIGGVNTAAKRRIQRKALHSCRKVRQPTPPPAPPAPTPQCASQCCMHDCATMWPACGAAGCCLSYHTTADSCAACTDYYKCMPTPAPSPSICGTICTSDTDCSMSTKCSYCTPQTGSAVKICDQLFTYKDHT